MVDIDHNQTIVFLCENQVYSRNKLPMEECALEEGNLKTSPKCCSGVCVKWLGVVGMTENIQNCKVNSLRAGHVGIRGTCT